MLLKVSYIAHLLLNKLFYNMLICCSRNCFFQKKLFIFLVSFSLSQNQPRLGDNVTKKDNVLFYTTVNKPKYLSQTPSSPLGCVLLYMSLIWYPLPSVQTEWMMHLYSALLCIVVHPKHFTIMWGVSPQLPPVCSIHLDDATAATGHQCQCAHHTPATGGEERES